MSNADAWVGCIAFAVIMAFLHSLHDRLKRIEDKIDKLGK
jgi:hypothetical protein